MVEDKRAGGSDAVKMGALLRAARKEAGLTQQRLGAKIGVTFQQIQKYESGKNRISSTLLTQVARAVGKPVTYFLEDGPGSVEEHFIARMLGVSHGVDLARAFLKLETTKARRKAVELIEGIGS